MSGWCDSCVCIYQWEDESVYLSVCLSLSLPPINVVKTCQSFWQNRKRDWSLSTILHLIEIPTRRCTTHLLRSQGLKVHSNEANPAVREILEATIKDKMINFEEGNLLNTSIIVDSDGRKIFCIVSFCFVLDPESLTIYPYKNRNHVTLHSFDLLLFWWCKKDNLIVNAKDGAELPSLSTAWNAF